MKHLGDITKINGQDVPAVNIVVGGSPCQDLSVAGKREGLAGQRSGLFMEQIRIIKEMRENDRTNKGADVDIRYIRPRFMVWENVPGAFSSNKGEDFRIVLEETAKIVCEDAVIPRPPKNKWQPSGCILGDGWSIAWRLHDAQFWGVPQRRKRIALVADFAGGAAPKILFESKSVSGNTSKSEEKRKDTSTIASNNIGETISWQERAGCAGGGKGILIQHERVGALSTVNNQNVLQTDCYSIDEKCGQTYIGEEVGNTLGARDYKQPQAVCYGISSYESNAMKSDNPYSGCYEANTSRTLDNNGGNPACNQGGIAVVCVDQGAGKSMCNITEELSPTLACTHGGEPVVCCYGIDRAAFNQGENALYNFSVEEELAQTLVAKGPGGGINKTVNALCASDYKGVSNQYVSDGKVIIQRIE